MPRTMSRPPGRPRTSRTFRYPDDLYAVLAAHAKETRRAVTTEIEIALEEYLGRLGKWPPGLPPPSGAGVTEAVVISEKAKAEAESKAAKKRK